MQKKIGGIPYLFWYLVKSHLVILSYLSYSRIDHANHTKKKTQCAYHKKTLADDY